MKKFYIHLSFIIALAPLRLCAAEIEQKTIKPSDNKTNTLIKNAQFLTGSMLICITAFSIALIPAYATQAGQIIYTGPNHPRSQDLGKFIISLALVPIITWYSAKGARYFLKKSFQEIDENCLQQSDIVVKEDDEL